MAIGLLAGFTTQVLIAQREISLPGVAEQPACSAYAVPVARKITTKIKFITRLATDGSRHKRKFRLRTPTVSSSPYRTLAIF